MHILTFVQAFRCSCRLLSMGIMSRRPKGILTCVTGLKFNVAFYDISNLASDT